MFNLHHYIAEKMLSIELRNTGGGGGHGSCSTGGVIWADKCTSKGTFCGIDMFGCNTIDDGLYSCSTIGQRPTLLEICPLGGCVPIPARFGSSHCRHGDCNSLYFYKGSNSIPIALHRCPTGACPKGATECPPTPPDDTCLCKAPGSICGSTFDNRCKIDKNSLYTCESKGDTPKFFIHCEFLSCRSGEDACDSKDSEPGTECECQRSSAICGASLSSKCGLDAGSLYTCTKKGGKPSSGDRCASNSCPNGADKGDDVPTPGVCKYKAAGKICSSTYPESCDFKPSWLYRCAAAGAPLICGSSFPAACGYDSASLYTYDKKGNKPTAPEKCAFNSCKSGGAGCDDSPESNADECKCKDKSMLCSSSFPANCGYDAGSLYTCSIKGLGPASSIKCPSNSCASGNKHCDTFNMCHSWAWGSIHGSIFPGECGNDIQALYICGDKDGVPKFVEKCASGACKSDNSGYEPVSRPGPCACKEDSKNICGTSFVSSCDLDAGSLYKCEKKGEKLSVVVEKCEPNSCKAGGEKCDAPPIAPEYRCKGSNKICGSSFPADCGWDAATLYECRGVDDIPIASEKCGSNSCAKGNSEYDEKVDPDVCVCQTTAKLCRSNFPLSCGLHAAYLYNCEARGYLPRLVEMCESNSCPKDSAKCDDAEEPDPDECKCKKSDDIFGSSFPLSCALDASSLFKCGAAGETPSLVCDSTFPLSCNFAASLYRCTGAGKKPTAPERCKSNSSTSGGDKCDAVTPIGDFVYRARLSLVGVCGSFFPSKCKIDPVTLFVCTGNWIEPVPTEKCVSGSYPADTSECDSSPCECSAKGDICGTDFPAKCNYEDGSLYTCAAKDEDSTLKMKRGSGSCPKGSGFCGPDFAFECGYAASGIHICGDVGMTPIFDHLCISGIYNMEEGHCEPGKCDCPHVGLADRHSLYKCSDVGERPIYESKCPSGACPINSTTCSDLKFRSCEKAGDICGSIFDEACGYAKATPYSFDKAGDDPVEKEKCDAKLCLAGDDKCSDIDKCACTRTGQICGHSIQTVLSATPSSTSV
ncbi:hypothetical protein BGW39_010943 [Mortierella sp. 14UC]|nr:hypothetical protein BGW39_010943 [Mortierella sp. 14UC]